MATKRYREEKKEVYLYPSRFGSHASMVVQEETDKLDDKSLVVCKDEFGLYVTQKSRLDNGLADTYRNTWRR